MQYNWLIADQPTAGPAPALREARQMPERHVEALARLLQWFGVEFHLVDGDTGELVH